MAVKIENSLVVCLLFNIIVILCQRCSVLDIQLKREPADGVWSVSISHAAEVLQNWNLIGFQVANILCWADLCIYLGAVTCGNFSYNLQCFAHNTPSLHLSHNQKLNCKYIPANFFWVKCVRFLSGHDRDFWKCLSHFPKISDDFPKTSQRCPKCLTIFRRPLNTYDSNGL